MNESPEERLPEDDAALLAQALAPRLPEADRAARMKQRILSGIGKARTPADMSPQAGAVAPAATAGTAGDQDRSAGTPPPSGGTPTISTVHVRDRQWRQVARGVEMCTLHEDEHSRSMLLRMQPDSFLLPHRHVMSEESILLEGDAIIGDDLRLAAGDYHFSPAGALHPLLQSPGGCIVYVRGEKGFRPRVTTGLFKRLLRGLSTRTGKHP